MTNSHSSPAKIGRIDFLEGLRGFLAIYVMFAHIGYFVGLSVLSPNDRETYFKGVLPLILNYFDLSGWDAVNMFMAMSGFVIFHLLDKGHETYLPYIIRRFFRLWPVFMLCIVAGVFLNQFYIDILAKNPWSQNSWIVNQLEVTTPIQSNRLPYFLLDIPMLHGIVPKNLLLNAGSAFSSLAWCISTEWQFYLCAAIFFRMLKCLRGTLVLTAFVVFSLSPYGERFFIQWVNPNSAILPLQLHWFFLGMITHQVWRDVEGNGLTSKNRIKTTLLVLFGVGMAVIKPRLIPAILGWLVVFAVLIDSATNKKNPFASFVRRVFDNQVSRYFGRISYPVYLLHWPISIIVLKVLVVWHPQSSWLEAYLILIVAVVSFTWLLAHLTHIYLEKPAMEFGRKLAARFSNPR
jgi:peptidoglycan/LPS O-acetylase OafA/YrhL